MQTSTKGFRARLILGAGAVVAALATISTDAHATRYEVPNNAPDRVLNDGVCSLREAIRASNLSQQVDSCPAGEAQNEIVIVGNPAVAVELTLPEVIEVTSWVTLNAPDGPGFRQAIRGNDTRFVVRKGGYLSVSALNFTQFKGTPLEVQGGEIAGRGLVRALLLFVNSEISWNTYAGAISQTMGILNTSGRVYMKDSSIHHNTSIKGGGIYNQSGILSVYGTAIYANTVTQYGGGIHNVGSGAKAQLYNVTLSGNLASIEGGGLYNGSGAIAELYSTTITGNRSAAGAGVSAKSGGTATIEHSIVSGNTNLSGSLRDCAGALVSQGYSLLQSCSETPSATGDIRNVSANLSSLTFPLSTQSWKLPPWHAPLPASPVINVIPVGTNDCVTLAGITDQIRNPRLVGAACDIGSIERQ
jgi:hypothetical protein